MAGPPVTLVAPVAGLLKVESGMAVNDRADLLKAIRAGTGPSKLEIDARVFLQVPTSNRNFVRFKAGILKSFGKSFAGQPFLRDHDKHDLAARGGTIVASRFEGEKGLGEILQTIELVKPWAQEAALDGTLDRFSIGWSNTGDVVCSECGAPIFTGFFGGPTCDHYPGDPVKDKNGDVTHYVEMLVTGAEGIETSGVTVPAVVGTGIEEIRAQLSADRRSRAATHHYITKEKRMSILAVATLMGLSADTSDEKVVSAVQELKLNHERATTLLESTKESLASERSMRETAEGKLKVIEEKAHAETIENLCVTLRRKVGQKIDDKGQPIRGGTPQERTMLKIAAHNLEEAKTFVEELEVIIPVGQPPPSMLSKVPGPSAVLLTENQRNVNRQLGISDEEFLKRNSTKVA